MNKILKKYNKLLEDGMEEFDLKKAKKEIRAIRDIELSDEEWVLKYNLLECLTELIKEDKQ